jgi:diguanylate cyclase (GGDEF)-like protein
LDDQLDARLRDAPAGPPCFAPATAPGGRTDLQALLDLCRAATAVPVALLAVTGGEVLASGEAGDRLAADGTFCRLAAETGETVVCEDAAGDARLGGRRLGAGGPPVRFYAGVPVRDAAGRAVAALVVAAETPRQPSADDLQRLRETAGIAAVLLADGRRAARLGDLSDALARQIERTRRDQAMIDRYRKMYERTSELGHIGVWECDLATERLTWTNGVYDIFELPRGTPVTRDLVLRLYERESRLRMERVRRKAIEEGSSGSLDIRIRTLGGLRRWVRLTIDVEMEAGRPVRIFGLKQDITQEKDLLERLRRLAEIDAMTGLANRSMFEGRLSRALATKGGAAPPVALALIDLDGFKPINDTFGHAAGDECLRQIGRRLRAVFRRPHEVGRIGGDEFAVLVRGRRNEAEVAALFEAAIAEISRPIPFEGREMSVGASIGVTQPPDMRAHDLGRLFAEADRAMYVAKRAGRNTVHFHATAEPLPPPPRRAPRSRRRSA